MDLDEYFQTSDYSKLKPSGEQSCLAGKSIQFVNGSDFYNNPNDIRAAVKIPQVVQVRYYQIAMFPEDSDIDRFWIRSFLFEGKSSKGECFFNYKMIEIKDYKLTQRKIDKFVKILDKKKQLNSSEHTKTKIMYKFYPVYNFSYTNPPTGSEINECSSPLLNQY